MKGSVIRGGVPCTFPDFAALHPSYIARQCPDSEVHIILGHARLRTSESKGTSNLLNLVWLWFRSPHLGLAARMMRTSEPPHLGTMAARTATGDRQWRGR